MAQGSTSSTATTVAYGSMSAPSPSNMGNIAHLLPIKLSGNNFNLWKAQFMPIFRLHQLLGYIDDTSPCPPQYVKNSVPGTDTEDTVSVNPAYITWQKNDQMILSWIIASLIESTMAHVVSCSTSYDAWQKLTRTYSSSSRVRVQQLRLQLENLKRGSTSCTEYLQNVRIIADNLAAIDKPMSNEDLILAAL
ncbi:PREDICTED: uncharacterized protein LOC104593666 [Nelumbo nucifera]|uniref:Uncharacterized protein LOC104593666 n=2 Tax=Nelumbo nucifera TaxID=4432 RepID=A0A1U7ZU78_NELNU|nr:PREDICTED: uncharacterized protein LOC104593666 [Nelumbo nucifera]DAD43323.1 TPA_asm: hypothetical protein HUJ06_001553 [Nelumbo nucifera]